VALSIVAVAVAALALWRSGASRGVTHSPTRAGAAYDRGDWAAAERAARESLKVRPDEAVALRVLARSSARLGRDDAAIALYSRRIDERVMAAEDYTLLGLALRRRGRPDEADRAWGKAMNADPIPPRGLEELARILIQHHRREEAARVAERLARAPGWEARGEMMLGTVRAALDDVAGAAGSFRLALDHDPKELDNSADPVGLGKLVARTFLRVGRAPDARVRLQATLSREPDPEAWWLLSRAYLQEKEWDRVREALARAGTYRADHPLEAEPSPYVGETRCQSCHAQIFRDSLASRHTRSYYRGDQLLDLPRPKEPLPDPDDPGVSHAIRRSDGSLREEIRVGSQVFVTVVEYAFGTSDRYLTMVGRDGRGGYRIARLSYHDTAEGRGWDRSSLDKLRPVRGEDFQGEAIGVRDGVAKCLYCHTTNPRSGLEPTGPETSDRAIGCERCHGPGGHHLAAVAAGFPDLAIINPTDATARMVTEKQCNDCHILGRDFREDVLDDPAWVRSQGVGWTFSRCNTESGGSFGCVTCHDPHRPSSSTTTAQYEARCLSCHSPAGHSKAGVDDQTGHPRASGAGPRPCPVNPSRDCLGCHMPRVRIAALHQSLTDHYIRIRSHAASPRDGGQPKSVR
jgi:tetratricopeptide (TPR) repeat protein